MCFLPSPFTTIGWFTVNTYSLLVALGILSGAGSALFGLRGKVKLGAAVDCMIAGLIGGVICARLFHVILNWPYFTDHTAEITQLRAGGLDWHGAVIGMLLLMFIAAKIQRISFSLLVESLTSALPLIAFFTWWGCGAAKCAYGAEVANLAYYPAWLVWEASDIFNIIAPRYRTQALGMILALVLLSLSAMLRWRGWLAGQGFWLILILLSLGMFLLGFLRGDAAFIQSGFRADQWLDAGLVIIGAAGIIIGVLQSARQKTKVV